MSKQEILEELRRYKENNSSRYGILAIGIFGSVARGEEKQSSDLDVFIKIDASNSFVLVHIKEDLEILFSKHVDIVRVRETMNQFLKKRIEQEGIYV